MLDNRTKILKVIYKILAWIVLIIILSVALSLLIRVFYKKAYPIEYFEEVKKISYQTGISERLIYSVIKTESNFDLTAISKKGAKGLMQIKDSTAKYVSEMYEIDSYDLFVAEDNIKIGTLYLKYLIEKFKNIDNALLAYNAGEGNVFLWLSNPAYSLDGKTVNNIPFEETAQYLKKIKKTFLKYNNLYSNILDKKL